MSECIQSSLTVQNIILVGFMAAGKSSVGQILAQELGWDYIDTDYEIERLTGFTVAELFSKYGEAGFRAEESHMVRRLANVQNNVIATGGGMILNPDNLARLEKIGILIHLYVPLKVALQRAEGCEERPLLAKNKEELERLWIERQDTYNKASLTIDTSDKDIAAMAAEILTLLKGGQG